MPAPVQPSASLSLSLSQDLKSRNQAQPCTSPLVLSNPNRTTPEIHPRLPSPSRAAEVQSPPTSTARAEIRSQTPLPQLPRSKIARSTAHAKTETRALLSRRPPPPTTRSPPTVSTAARARLDFAVTSPLRSDDHQRPSSTSAICHLEPAASPHPGPTPPPPSFTEIPATRLSSDEIHAFSTLTSHCEIHDSDQLLLPRLSFTSTSVVVPGKPDSINRAPRAAPAAPSVPVELQFHLLDL